MKKISIKKLLKLNNPIIYDIRNSNDFNLFHIPNSINIPFIQLQKNYQKILNTNIKYYIICEQGHNSKTLVKLLNKNKYKAIHVKNGINSLNKFNF